MFSTLGSEFGLLVLCLKQNMFDFYSETHRKIHSLEWREASGFCII